MSTFDGSREWEEQSAGSQPRGNVNGENPLNSGSFNLYVSPPVSDNTDQSWNGFNFTQDARPDASDGSFSFVELLSSDQPFTPTHGLTSATTVSSDVVSSYAYSAVGSSCAPLEQYTGLDDEQPQTSRLQTYEPRSNHTLNILIHSNPSNFSNLGGGAEFIGQGPHEGRPENETDKVGPFPEGTSYDSSGFNQGLHGTANVHLAQENGSLFSALGPDLNQAPWSASAGNGNTTSMTGLNGLTNHISYRNDGRINELAVSPLQTPFLAQGIYNNAQSGSRSVNTLSPAFNSLPDFNSPAAYTSQPHNFRSAFRDGQNVKALGQGSMTVPQAPSLPLGGFDYLAPHASSSETGPSNADTFLGSVTNLQLPRRLSASSRGSERRLRNNRNSHLLQSLAPAKSGLPTDAWSGNQMSPGFQNLPSDHEVALRSPARSINTAPARTHVARGPRRRRDPDETRSQAHGYAYLNSTDWEVRDNHFVCLVCEPHREFKTKQALRSHCENEAFVAYCPGCQMEGRLKEGRLDNIKKHFKKYHSKDNYEDMEFERYWRYPPQRQDET